MTCLRRFALRFRLALAAGWLAALCGLCWSAAASAQESPATAPADHAPKMQAGLELFKASVRDLLSKHCLACHGGAKTEGDFDLSDRDKLFDSGQAGDSAEESPLFALIQHAEEPHMPHKQDKLPDEAIAAIGKWLDLGAPYDKPLAGPERDPAGAEASPSAKRSDFWSFQPLAVVAPPEVKQAAWTRTPIDRFVAAAQEAKGLHGNPPAAKRVLIRRAYFDLIGLPPTPEEVEAFVEDSDPAAYEKLLDRLLALPQYGERWARHWMDVARFAESHGYEQDYDRPFAFYYRDFLIRAFNDDLPFDQFIRWQLAGDEFAPDNPWALAATGFLGGGAFPTQLTENEFERARYDELDDMTSTTGSAFLGLSVGCARCHDHKYDPIASADYYRLASAFTTTIRSEIELTLPGAEKPEKVQVTSEGFPKTKHHADDRGFPHFYPETFVLNRGDPSQKKEPAELAFLPALMRDGRDTADWQVAPPEGWTRTSFRRASLANWITDPRHGAGHLAARVIVNRLWHLHFGRGIVASPNDFGMQGERPSHPELLDWLATDLVHNGWQLKRLHKLIMLSAVYQQDGSWDEARAAIDRENMLLWRRPPRRLEAEPIRDQMLAASGLLDSTMYGAGTLDPNHRRRSIYFFIKRSQLIPNMMLFDWPEHLVSIGARSSTTIAPQALLFLNGPQTRQYAEGLAARAQREAPSTPVERAYAICLGRAPNDDERQLAAQFLEAQHAKYTALGDDQAKHTALVDFCQALFGMNEFVYVE